MLCTLLTQIKLIFDNVLGIEKKIPFPIKFAFSNIVSQI